MDLRKKLDDPQAQIRDQLPGVGQARTIEAQTPFSFDELAAQFKMGYVLYVAAMVRYTADGHEYTSETCVYFVDVPPLLGHACQRHNVNGVRQR